MTGESAPVLPPESAVCGSAESAPAAAAGLADNPLAAFPESALAGYEAVANAFRCRLPVFDGPLDLLLFLVRENRMDIHAIPIAEITQQYHEYVTVIEEIDLNLAGEFLEMGSLLLRWKARSLLPVPPEPLDPEDAEDPQERLARMLLEYQRYKAAAGELRERFDRQADFIRYPGSPVDREVRRGETEFEEVSLFHLLKAFKQVMELVGKTLPQVMPGEAVTVEQMQDDIRGRLQLVECIRFTELFLVRGTRLEIIVTFLALLELMKTQEVRVHQAAGEGEIYIYPHRANPAEDEGDAS